uniref:Uncharacterized protein n=1 Tax=Arundo donax TaxID=35708 RepID=A0A0A9HCC5_ARUDO
MLFACFSDCTEPSPSISEVSGSFGCIATVFLLQQLSTLFSVQYSCYSVCYSNLTRSSGSYCYYLS